MGFAPPLPLSPATLPPLPMDTCDSLWPEMVCAAAKPCCQLMNDLFRGSHAGNVDRLHGYAGTPPDLGDDIPEKEPLPAAGSRIGDHDHLTAVSTGISRNRLSRIAGLQHGGFDHKSFCLKPDSCRSHKPIPQLQPLARRGHPGVPQPEG